MVWHRGGMVFSRNPKDRALPSGHSAMVGLTDEDSRLIATDRADDICVLVGIRDTDRKMAIRRLVVVIDLALFAVLGLGFAAFAVRRAVNRLKVSAKVSEQ